MKPIPKTEEEWKKALTPEQYAILRQKGTEAPYSGRLKQSATGTFRCSACGNPIFSVDAQFDSSSGWPSFDQALPNSVKRVVDGGHGMQRVEVLCSRCDSHLGHVFDDGPTETGMRYCINSVCLE